MPEFKDTMPQAFKLKGMMFKDGQQPMMSILKILHKELQQVGAKKILEEEYLLKDQKINLKELVQKKKENLLDLKVVKVMLDFLQKKEKQKVLLQEKAAI